MNENKSLDRLRLTIRAPTRPHQQSLGKRKGPDHFVRASLCSTWCRGYRVNPFLTTVSVTVAVWVLPPPVPVIVMVCVPTVARVPTLTVIVDDPEPGAAMGFGLKVTVCWLPSPEADNVTAESKPFSAAVVIVEVPDWPLTTDIAVGDALMLKSAFAGAVTVRATVAVCVTPPPVPVTVIV